MVPPKKKRKFVPSTPVNADPDRSSMDVEDPSHTNVNGTAAFTALISRKNLLTKELIGQMETLESSSAPSSSLTDGEASNAASIGILRLKSLQRGVLVKIRKTQERLKEQGVVRDKQELKLENLRYQHTIHQKSQTGSDRAVESTSLEIAKLVRESQTVADGKTTSKTEIAAGEDNTDAALLLKFLGDDWRDPSKRQPIVAKLNREVATRKKLEDELNRLKTDRTSKKEALVSRQKLLRDLPSKLADMEKASLPLQKFCQKQSNSSSSSLMKVTPKLGTTKRRNRLDLAKNLPKALYTLFHQLQSCLDVMETSQGSLEKADISPEALPTVEIDGSAGNEAVVLKLPIPTLSTGGGLGYKPKKQASVSFRYDATLDMVLAACGTDYDMGMGVIDELFPGDKGEFLVGENEPSSSTLGRAYQWCNYLGGLHVSPGEQTAARMHSSARVIVRALVRRVRATATLSWILHGLSRKPSLPNFPQHAALVDTGYESSATRLSSWTALTTNNSTDTNTNMVRVYKAILQHGNGNGEASKKVAAKVSIDLARYPSRIPQWKILSSPNANPGGEDEEVSLDVLRGSQEGEAPQQLPLYNEALTRLEQNVNRKVDQLVDSSDQTTYDWILAQQLVEIAKGWEDSLQVDIP